VYILGWKFISHKKNKDKKKRIKEKEEWEIYENDDNDNGNEAQRILWIKVILKLKKIQRVKVNQKQNSKIK